MDESCGHSVPVTRSAVSAAHPGRRLLRDICQLFGIQRGTGISSTSHLARLYPLGVSREDLVIRAPIRVEADGMFP